jgi:two-component system response regulator HydG
LQQGVFIAIVTHVEALADDELLEQRREPVEHLGVAADAHLDVLALAFVRKFAEQHGKSPLAALGAQAISREAWQALRGYSYPGNVRELANAIERAVVFAQSEIRKEDLPLSFRLAEGGAQNQDAAVTIAIGTPLKEVEDLLIRRTLEVTAGDKEEAARLLGIASRTVYRKLEHKP